MKFVKNFVKKYKFSLLLFEVLLIILTCASNTNSVFKQSIKNDTNKQMMLLERQVKKKIRENKNKSKDCFDLDLKKADLDHMVTTHLDSNENVKIKLMELPSSFLEKIIQDKIKCDVNTTYKGCNSLLRRITQFNDILKNELDPIENEKKDSKNGLPSKNFQYLINTILSCHKPKKDMFIIPNALIKPNEFKVDCDCLNDAKNIIKTVLENTADKSPLANNYLTPPSSNFLKYVNELESCMAKNQSKSIIRQEGRDEHQQRIKMELEFKEKIKRYEEEIFKLKQKNQILTEEIENLKKIKTKFSNEDGKDKVDNNICEEINAKYIGLKVHVTKLETEIKIKDERIERCENEKKELIIKLGKEKSGKNVVVNNNSDLKCRHELSVIKVKLDICESEKQKLTQEVKENMKQCENEKTGVKKNYEKIIATNEERCRKETKIYNDNYKNCQTEMVKFIKRSLEKTEKIVKEYEEKIKTVRNEITIKEENFNKEKEILLIKIKACEEENEKLRNKCEDEKYKIKTEFRQIIDTIKIESRDKKKLLTEEINKLKKELEQCNQAKISINNEIILIQKKITLECDSKISQINIKVKSNEDLLKHQIEALTNSLKECKDEKTRIIKANIEEKREVEKLHKEKIKKMALEHKLNLEQCKKELEEERSKIKTCEEKRIKHLTICQEEISITIKKYQQEILDLKKSCSKDQTKFFDFQKEILEINKKYDECQRNSVSLIKKHKEENLKLEEQCKIRIEKVKAEFKITQNNYEIKIETLEKEKLKCFDDNFKNMERCRSEKILVEKTYKLEIINIRKEIQTTKDLALKELEEINSKLKICESEKTNLNTLIETIKQTNKNCEINLENCNKEKDSKNEQFKKEKKELKLTIEGCQRDKLVVTRDLETERTNIRRCKEDINNIKEEEGRKFKRLKEEKDEWEKKYQTCLLEKMQFKSAVEQKVIIIKNHESTIRTINQEYKIKTDNLNEKVEDLLKKLKKCEEENKSLTSKLKLSNTKLNDYTQKIILIKREYEDKLEKCNNNNNELNRSITNYKNEIHKLEIKISNIEKSHDNCKDEVKMLREDKKNLESQLKEIQKQYSDKLKLAEDKISKLNTQLNEKQTLYEQCKLNIESYQSDNEKLKKIIEELKKEFSECTGKLKNAEKKIEEKRTQITSYINQIDLIKVEKNACEDKHRKYSQEMQFEISKFTQEKANLEKKNEEIKKLYETCQYEKRKLIEKNKMILVLKKDLEECKNKLLKCENQKKIVVTKYETVFKVYNECKTQINIIKLEFKTKKDLLDRDILDITTKYKTCEEEKLKIKSKEGDTTQKEDSCETKIIEINKTFNSRIEILEKEIRTTREKCSENELAKSKCEIELKDSKDKLHESQKKIKALKIQISEKESKCKLEISEIRQKLKECEEEKNNNKENSEKIITELQKQITNIKNELVLKVKIFKTENDVCNNKVRLLEDKLKLCIDEKEKCRKEIFEIKNKSETNLKINIKVLKNDLDSLKEKLKTCNEEKTSITNKFEIEIKNLKKTCADNEEKLSRECSKKNELYMREMEGLKEKFSKIISEKNNEIVEIKQSKSECDKIIEKNKKEITDLRDKILSLKNQLLICTTNKDYLNKSEMSLKIKIENLNKLVSQYFSKIKTCEDNTFKLKEEINRLTVLLQDSNREINNIKTEKNGSIELLECQNIIKLKDIEINNLKKEKSLTLEKCEILLLNKFKNNSNCPRFEKLTSAVISVCGDNSKKLNKKSKRVKEKESNLFITSLASSHRYDNLIDEVSMFTRLNKGSSSTKVQSNEKVSQKK